MSNTLTSLTPDLYQALDVVSRELVGFIPSVSRDSSLERAALNQTIRSFVAPVSTASDITPGSLPPDDGDQTIANKTITISKSRYVPVRWQGEEQKGMDSGPGYANIRANQFAQAMRALTNEMEADLSKRFTDASRAVSPSGTNLFDAANYNDVANVRKIVIDNGAPQSDLTLVLNTTAGAALRGNAQYTGYQNAGTDDILRQGVLLDIHGVAIRESAQVQTSAIGTAASATTDASGYAIGTTTITVAAAGTGTILAGDVVSFAGDTNKYVVASGVASAAAGGTLVLNAPGLKVAMSTATKAITVDSHANKNMCFSRNAIHLVTRVPARPYEGDLAEDVMMVQDPRSGIAFEVAMYKQYRRVKYEVSMAWGFSTIKNEHLALLIG